MPLVTPGVIHLHAVLDGNAARRGYSYGSHPGVTTLASSDWLLSAVAGGRRRRVASVLVAMGSKQDLPRCELPLIKDQADICKLQGIFRGTKWRAWGPIDLFVQSPYIPLLGPLCFNLVADFVLSIVSQMG